MDYNNVPPLLKDIIKSLRSKGIKFQYAGSRTIITRTFTKELHPVIFSIDAEFSDRVTIQSVPLNNYSFSCSAQDVDEIIRKAGEFCRTVKSYLQ